jgi:hypothetical protein
MRSQADAVQHRAFERYTLELVSGWAEIEERLHREHFGEEPYIAIREVTLSGEYPRTVLRLRRYHRSLDRETWHTALLWQDPTFFDDETGAPLVSPERMAGDILMLARGG